ncbi:MAG: MBL fold metallo-hydrolase [Rhodospirillales bacterium]|nr:MBL fold metallo-hydrolase [Rhodospirillales bacterium]
MAAEAKRLAANAAGDFFVDSTCIDCSTCRWVAPANFDETEGASRVYRQPATEAERHQARMAVIACPVGAIGTTTKHDLHAAEAAFPDQIAENVFHCGYHARSSYGAASYLIVRPEGNVLIDSPRFARPLIRRIEALGGVRTMFLTHCDDIADHQKFRDHFGLTRILHTADARGLAVEMPITGREPIRLAEDIALIPVPGHTRGSACLLYRDKFLFTGDHLSWRPGKERLGASRDVCWYDWDEQTASMAALADYRFEWILPGHGHRHRLAADAMAAEMKSLVQRMKRAA